MSPEHHVNVHVLGTVAVFTPPIDRPENSDIKTDKTVVKVVGHNHSTWSDQSS